MRLSPRLLRALAAPVDASWLVAFRVVYGVAMAVSMLRFIAYGWVDRFFVTPRFHFKYWGFEWVEALPGPHMHILFWVLAGLALAVAAGALFRVAAVGFAAGLTYVQLIDVSTYLNHYYLAALLAWLLAASPANHANSLDAWFLRRRRGGPHGSSRSAVGPLAPAPTLPAAWLYLFRFQVGVVYLFAGLAKAQSDWLLHGQPLGIWLGAKTDLPVIGPLLTLEGVPLLMSWCGFLFDTTIVVWLLLPKTRPWAYAIVILFHVMTRLLFPIGMFPIIMALSALVFFDPDWPRQLLLRARALRARWGARGSRLVGESGQRTPTNAPATAPRRGSRLSPLGLTLAATYCIAQVALPLRFLGYGGNVLWHEQGMRFSWRVMVRAKGGSTTFVVEQPSTGRSWHVNPGLYLTGMQQSEMSSQPDLILQLASHIRDDMARRGLGRVVVRAESHASLNGRRSARLIDPSIDLGAITDGLGRAEWVLPGPAESPPQTRPVL